MFSTVSVFNGNYPAAHQNHISALACHPCRRSPWCTAADHFKETGVVQPRHSLHQPMVQSALPNDQSGMVVAAELAWPKSGAT